MTIKRVEDLKRPLIKGEELLVPCLVKRESVLKDESEMWLDLTNSLTKTKMHILPVINHPHNDIENGQTETHFHLDYRFLKHKNDGNFPTVKNKSTSIIFGGEVRPDVYFGSLEYFSLPVINEDFTGITPKKLISKSKLKHKCIHKGKCPHRGYDLSQVKADEYGIKTCPLHGLMFNKEGEILK